MSYKQSYKHTHKFITGEDLSECAWRKKADRIITLLQQTDFYILPVHIINYYIDIYIPEQHQLQHRFSSLLTSSVC